MLKKLFIPVIIAGMVFFIQCTDEYEVPEPANPVLKAGKGNGNGGGGGNGGGSGGGGGLYGDLIICLRTPDGIPVYQAITGEHGLAYYPLPIKIDEQTLEPLLIEDAYQTFDLNDEGEPIPELGYIVQEVEFGRLNIVRAPQSVLDQALGEAIGNLLQPGVSDITTDASGRLVAIIGAEDWLVNYDNDPANDEVNDKTIDSPRENVAIYQELLSYGFTGALSFLQNDYNFTNADILHLAWGAIAAGADKTGTMNVDEFAYMNNWLLKWQNPGIHELPGSPDVKGRHYYDYTGFTYSREDTYANKYLKITVLNPDGTWSETFQPVLDVVSWTPPSMLIDYENGNNINLSGFSNAADDAIQVLEFIHSSDLIEYSPYFTSAGFIPPY